MAITAAASAWRRHTRAVHIGRPPKRMAAMRWRKDQPRLIRKCIPLNGLTRFESVPSRPRNPFSMQRISERRVWLAGARVAGGGLIHLVATLLVLRLIHASLVGEVWLIASNVVDGVRGKRRGVGGGFGWVLGLSARGGVAPGGCGSVAQG